MLLVGMRLYRLHYGEHFDYSTGSVMLVVHFVNRYMNDLEKLYRDCFGKDQCPGVTEII